MNYCEEFQNYMAAHGLPIPHVIDDGEIHRFKVPGDKGSQKSGWYSLSRDVYGAGGCAGDWRDGSKLSWYAQREPVSPADLARMKAEREKNRIAEQQKREAAYREAASRARQELDSCQCYPDQENEYLKRKKIRAPEGVYFKGSSLVIPVCDAEHNLQSLQYISFDGSKRFLKGGKVQGGFFAIGKPTAWIYICEGFATGVTIHESTQSYTLCAFNSGNLKAVAQAARKKYPNSYITICADDDRFNKKNVGRDKASEAAFAVSDPALPGNGVRVEIPSFCESVNCRCTDFNDVANCAIRPYRLNPKAEVCDER